MMLLSLPNEILIVIVHGILDRKDKVNLASCSRRLLELLLPYAYETVTVNSTCKQAVSRLTTTVIRNKTLAPAVRHIRLIEGSCKHRRKLLVHRQVIDYALQFASTDCETQEWRDALLGRGIKWCDGQGDAWKAVLFSLLRNLETLEMYWEDVIEFQLRVFERAAMQRNHTEDRQVLPRLQDVRLLGGERLDVAEVKIFFLLPSMRKLSCYFINDTPMGDDLPERTSPIRELSLYHSLTSTGFSTAHSFLC
ncbi:hypothetical protein BJX70DRAFT_338122 [Aspergillus crustosus]